MNYKELQKEAKELGIKSVGVKAEDLAKKIKEAKQTPQQETSEYNAAIVYDGNREVRRYTAESHGDKFADLAQQFAIKRKYRLELVTLSEGIVCPACGHKFHSGS